MNDIKLGITIIILSILLHLSIFIVTHDNKNHIHLDVVTKMTAKCDNNGGIESITHGYDVTCKNGAKFPFKG